jgi:hypothetical protein
VTGRRAGGFATTTGGVKVAYPLRAADVKARERRNSLPIHGYTGSNGGGKTMCAVYDSLPTLAAGRPVVSTCRILDPTTGEPHPLWVPLDDFRLLLELSFCDVILDEVTGVASSRDSAGMPSAVLNHLMQLRKGDVTIRWTTPNWKRADVGIREVTQGLTTCIGFIPEDKRIVTDDGLVRRWKPRRSFLWRTYDARKFDEWSTAKERSSSKQHRIRPVARQLIWGPGAPVRDCYDTYENALTLGVVSEAGLCMDCGGKRQPRKCGCSPGAAIADPSAGMLRWREVDAGRRRPVQPAGVAAEDLPVQGTSSSPLTEDLPALPVLFEETDDTPAVLVEPAASR